MAANVAALLDKAKVMHRLSSDYKLALVMGVSHKSLSSYRHGMTLPDARVIALLCELTGDDPAVILAEVEEQRAATPEAKALWHTMALRLQQAAAAGVFSVLAAVVLAVGFPSGEAYAKPSAGPLHPLYIVEGGPRRHPGAFPSIARTGGAVRSRAFRETPCFARRVNCHRLTPFWPTLDNRRRP